MRSRLRNLLCAALLLAAVSPAAAQRTVTETEFPAAVATFIPATTEALFPGLLPENEAAATAFAEAILADPEFVRALYVSLRVGPTAMITDEEFVDAIVNLIESTLVGGAVRLSADDQAALMAAIATVPDYLATANPSVCAGWLRGTATGGLAVIVLTEAGTGPADRLAATLDLASRAILARTNSAAPVVTYTDDELTVADRALTAAMAAEAADVFMTIAGGNADDATLCAALSAQFGAYATLEEPMRSHAIAAFLMRRI
ncbi:MAG: hypothetical protein AB7O56_13710 [Bauldia sp.]